MAKIDLPENWESEDDTVFMESEPGGLFGGVFLLIFAGAFGLPGIESLSYGVDPYEDSIGAFGVLIFSLLSVTLAVFGLKSIWNSRVVWRWEINLADKRFMLKKIRGSQTKVRWDRDLGGGAVLKIMESGDDNFTIGFEGPDWKETLWHHSWGYSRTRAFAESLSDAIGIEIVDERRRGISEDSETWWEEKVEHDSEPEERMDMRMATRDPDAQIDESVVGGHIRLKGNSKMLYMTLVFVVFGIFVAGSLLTLPEEGEWWQMSYPGGYCEWEGDVEAVEEGDDTRWYCKNAEASMYWDTWWFYCELHGLDWRCTDDFGQSEVFRYSMENGDESASEGGLMFWVGYGFFSVIVFLVLIIVGYFGLIRSSAWTSVTVHDDKLVLRRLASMRIDSLTYKEVSKSSISAIGLERIWHEDNDDD